MGRTYFSVMKEVLIYLLSSLSNDARSSTESRNKLREKLLANGPVQARPRARQPVVLTISDLQASRDLGVCRDGRVGPRRASGGILEGYAFGRGAAGHCEQGQ